MVNLISLRTTSQAVQLLTLYLLSQVKLFQEAWERENGYFFTDNLPPYTKYAEDILRSDSSKGSAKPAAL